MLEPDGNYYYPRRIPVKSSLFHPPRDRAAEDRHRKSESTWDKSRKSGPTWDSSDVQWDQLLLADVTTRNGKIKTKKQLGEFFLSEIYSLQRFLLLSLIVVMVTAVSFFGVKMLYCH
jgi:hypothetical protein